MSRYFVALILVFGMLPIRGWALEYGLAWGGMDKGLTLIQPLSADKEPLRELGLVMPVQSWAGVFGLKYYRNYQYRFTSTEKIGIAHGLYLRHGRPALTYTMALRIWVEQGQIFCYRFAMGSEVGFRTAPLYPSINFTFLFSKNRG